MSAPNSDQGVSKKFKSTEPKILVDFPPVIDILKANSNAVKDRKDTSLPTTKMFIVANYKVDVEKLSAQIHHSIDHAVEKGFLAQVDDKSGRLSPPHQGCCSQAAVYFNCLACTVVYPSPQSSLLGLYCHYSEDVVVTMDQLTHRFNRIWPNVVLFNYAAFLGVFRIDIQVDTAIYRWTPKFRLVYSRSRTWMM
ncbi:histone H1/5 [Clonorchis sinensis]|uniref:Histone H1/5 n=1 Tax=Clonorchis sinensis TaxID=79923 RepID=H2KRF7_CLOSI|nr:histone H1/5 [Clonorchis sinensis]